MKFKKHMEELKVSEWDSQYLNYKAGKKKIKDLCRAIPRAKQYDSKYHNPITTLLNTRAGFQKIQPEQQEDDPSSTPSRQPSAGNAGARYERRGSGFSPGPLLKRMTNFGTIKRKPVYKDTTAAQEKAEAGFIEWLQAELSKVEAFYKAKENEAVKRFRDLEEQLVIMNEKTTRKTYSIGYGGVEIVIRKRGTDSESDDGVEMDSIHSKALKERAARADYERSNKYRKPINRPVEQAARKRLKYACTEYYRRLEFLRSYITTNREGFRKITKKFDKASGLGMSGQYMNNHIMRSYFGGTDNKLDQLLNGTELLVAKFFYQNDRRMAASKIRTRGNKSDYHSSFLRSGMCLGAAFIIGNYAVWEAIRQMTQDHDEDLAERTKYVMQLWAGISLFLLQALLFATNLRVWAQNKINYAFIFEFDPRHHLNHRQFLEIPSFAILAFSICLWFSIHDFWRNKLDMIHFPIIYLGLVGSIIFNPFNFFFLKARIYFLTTLWRLASSGFYHVEFKDFWLGDMLGSQSFALSQTYLFFCLYARGWKDPGECSSDSLKLWGIIGALPAFWRFIQCFRRYKDSGQWFPHLPNGLKYGFVLGYYVTLNLWRTDKENHVFKALFLGIAIISSTAGLFWDVILDWSLGNPYAEWPLLRDTMYFRNPWMYYAGIAANTVLRFTWVLYVVFANEKKYAPLLGFCIGTGEIFRRFIWCFFRMENEHKGNVEAMRAYRDPKLPYRFKEDDLPAQTPTTPVAETTQSFLGVPTVEHLKPAADIETGASTAVKRNATMSTLHRLGRTLSRAHRADYERKKRPMEDDEDDQLDQRRYEHSIWSFKTDDEQRHEGTDRVGEVHAGGDGHSSHSVAVIDERSDEESDGTVHAAGEKRGEHSISDVQERRYEDLVPGVDDLPESPYDGSPRTVEGERKREN